MRSFSIIDLLATTALIAIHFAAFPVEATGSSDWPKLLYLTPTAITCLIHYRLQLRVEFAIMIHYLATLVWTFLHALGTGAAHNAYVTANPSPSRTSHAVFANAWNDTLEMAIWGIAVAAAYGAVCYTAVNSDGSIDSSDSNSINQNGG